jgi:RHS repeat-associated protein
MQIGQVGYGYTFDANGNMLSETTSRHFEWNHSDQMKTFRTQTAGAEPSVYARYLYDAAGQRVKKLVRKQGGQVEVTHYIDAVFEHHRWSGAQPGANNHAHVIDDKQRIAIVRLGPAHPGDGGPATQFHLGDHLGSSNAVVDSTGALINREEFTPFGETSFGSFARKRYRFTGMERDEESGLSYHGARFYAAWLAKWVSVDPEYLQFPAWSPFSYAFDNPVRFGDPTGRSPQDEDWVEAEPTAWSRGLDFIRATDDMPQSNQTYTYLGAMARREPYEQRAMALSWELSDLTDQRAEMQALIAEAKKLHFEETRFVWPTWGTLKTAASVAGVLAACYASAGACLLAIGVEGYSIIDKKNGDAAKIGATLHGCSKGVKADCAIGVVTQVVEWGAEAKQKAINDQTKPAAERLKLMIADLSARRDLLDARINAVKKDFSYNRLVSKVWEDWANWTRAGRPDDKRPYNSTAGGDFLRYYWKPGTLPPGTRVM